MQNAISPCQHLVVRCLCCGKEGSPAQLLASHTSERKRKSSAENGKKGGRPKKEKPG